MGGGANKYSLDALKKPVLLSSAGQQVMMEWEKTYMEQCVDALGITSTCDVLEVGFGMGYSAYSIIECDPVVLKRLREWASQYTNVHIVPGMWQSQLATLGRT
jgi:16S rRNA A1518/A1519 N6-dimethyltransferase RsmA/KsgA/DIM1 with predicted DNA glycosylase/AP lyase activity